jgi:hypothetical protein
VELLSGKREVLRSNPSPAKKKKALVPHMSSEHSPTIRKALVIAHSSNGGQQETGREIRALN